ncbi:MAG TPA: hypothetical protein VK730_10880 [Solirubrobacteraceae bacterium]|jgi:hypothetical protein|nr:hypothetical protein [Solirubrobacteraceae bacterium]
MRRTSQMVRIACIASFLACAFVPTSASASVGPSPGTISTFAGSPVYGPVSATSIGAGGGTVTNIATATLGGTPYAYYADAYQNVVRRIDLTTGQEQVVAGNGGFGAAVDGSLATETTVGPAGSVAVDSNGDMAILAEYGKVLFVPVSSGSYFGESMSAGHIYTLSSLDAQAIALSPQGNLVYSYDGTMHLVSIASGTTTPIPGEGSISGQDVAVDSTGDVAFVGGGGGGEDEIQLVPASSSGTYTGASAKGAYFGISMPDAGTAYPLVDSCHDNNCFANPGNGGPAPNATIGSPKAIAFDAQGDLTIADGGVDGVRFVPSSGGTYFGQTMTAGDIYAIAGDGIGAITDGATATSVALVPAGVSIDSSGDLVAAGGLDGVVLVSGASDDIQTIAGDGSYGYDGDGIEGATAQFGQLSWIASDATGNVAIVDGADSRVRFIPTTSGTYFGQAMTAGDIYTVAGNGIPQSIGNSGIGGPATAAKFDTFQDGGGIALDASGDLAIADPNNGRVCFVPAQSGEYYGQSMTAGDVYTLGGSIPGSDVTFDPANDLFATAGTDIEELAAGTSTPTTVPGSLGTDPYYLAVDMTGDVAFASYGGTTISLIPAQGGNYFGQSGLSAGTPTVIAGNGKQGYAGDEGTATSAELDYPSGLTFDAADDLVIAQDGSGSPHHEHDAVRFLPQTTGEFYGQKMTAGDIYTIAGNGTSGFLGDGGLGTEAELAEPTSIAMMPGEDVLIADQSNNRVRLLSGSVPTATTGAAGTPTAESDTIAGSVNPQGRPIGYHFEYGTTTAYGASQPTPDPSVGSDHAGHSESQELSGLAPGTTYHYRIVADYDEAGATISVAGKDATFTTAAGTGEVLKTTGPGAGTTTGTTTSGTEPTKSPVLGPTTAPKISPILQCTTAQVALIDVVQQGSRVEITGAARLVLAGKRVSIKFLATHKVVATATIAANGTFSASAVLPPSKIRESNLARYEAIVGSLHSLNLKLDRRMYMTSATHSGEHVLLSGYVTGSFKAGAVVKILLRVTCSSEKVIAKVKLDGAGKFNATVPAPTGAASQIAVYRGTTTVLKDGHPETTFTLPTPPGN